MLDHPVHIISLQYLNGCNRYFATAVTDQMIPSSHKSAVHMEKGPLIDTLLDDYIGFQKFDQSLTKLGLVNDEKMKLYEAIAGILHLGNVNFEESGDGCKISDWSELSLQLAASLFHVDKSQLRQLLITKEIIVGNMNITCVYFLHSCY